MTAVSRDEIGVEPNFREPDPELIRKHGHYHLDPESHAEYRIPAEPAGRHLIVRRVKNEHGALETRLDWAPWWDNIPAEKRALVLKARAEQDEEKLRDILAQLGITNLQNPEHLRQAVMLGLRDRVAGWIDEPPEILGPPKPPPAGPTEPKSVEKAPAEKAPAEEVTERPVSASLEASKGMKRLVKKVNQIVDSVHVDGTLHELPVRRARTKTRLGHYKFYRGGRGAEIGVSSGGDHQELTLAHEIGHFLDHQGIGTPGGYASADHELMAEWRDAVERTASITRLEEMRKSMEPVKDAHGRDVRPSQAHLDYLLSKHEIWARAYSQYIATRSRDERLLKQVERRRQAYIYQDMWTDEDFTPVAAAIDRLFEHLGWRQKTRE